MMSKRLVMIVVVVFLVLLSSFSVVALNESSCSGFWGSVSCFLWGDPALREGKALVGEATNVPNGAKIDKMEYFAKGAHYLKVTYYMPLNPSSGLSFKATIEQRAVGEETWSKINDFDTWAKSNSYPNNLNSWKKLDSEPLVYTPSSESSTDGSSPAKFESDPISGWKCTNQGCTCAYNEGCYDEDGNLVGSLSNPSKASSQQSPGYKAPSTAINPPSPYKVGDSIPDDCDNSKSICTISGYELTFDDGKISKVISLAFTLAPPKTPARTFVGSYSGKEVYVDNDGTLYYKDGSEVTNSEVAIQVKATPQYKTAVTKSKSSSSKSGGPGAPSVPVPEKKYEYSVADDGMIKVTVDGTVVDSNYHLVKETKGPGGKQVYQYYDKDKFSDEYYVEHNGELVRVVEKEGKWAYVNNEGIVVDDVTHAKRSDLVVKGKARVISFAGRVVTEDQATSLQKNQKSARKGMVDALGDLFEKYQKQLGADQFVDEEGALDMSGPNGHLKIQKDGKGYYVGYSYITDPVSDKSKYEDLIIRDQQVVVSQSAEQKDQGMVKLYDGTSVLIGKDVNIRGVADSGLTYYKDDEAQGSVKLDGSTLYHTNFDDETQLRQDLRTGDKVMTEGDYYRKGEKDAGRDECTQEGGCYFASKGTVTDKKGKVIELRDYGYKGMGTMRTIEQVEIFNPKTGRLVGLETDLNSDGTLDVKQVYKGNTVTITALTEQGKIAEGTFTRESDGTWKNGNGKISRTFEDTLEGNYQRLQSLHTAQTVFESIYAISDSLKSYPALSKLLYGDTETYKKWQNDVDRSFAPLLGTSWFPSTICEGHYDIEPQGKAMIKTISGTYQAVASIQMERSEGKSPILCQRKTTEEGEEFVCGKEQMCSADGFCYKDSDEDGEADEEKPLEGYFYKITWAVAAPRDESLTPYVDENGVAVSFNVYLDSVADDAITQGAVPLYRTKNGNTKGPVELVNGASDKNVIVQYSPSEYQEACIGWDKAPIMAPTAPDDDGESLSTVCFSVVTSSVGQVNWQRSGQPASSVTTSDGQVTTNTDW